MDPTVKSLLFTIAAYMVGSIPVGLIVCQLWAGIDIRDYGSGNIGMTNIYRTLKDSHGHLPWILTLVLDFIKGYIPVFLAVHWLSNGAKTIGPLYSIYIAMVILAVMLGNIYPIYIYFRGGKGVATGLGVFAALMGVSIFIPLGIFLTTLAITRMVSAGSILAAISLPVTVHFMGVKEWGIFSQADPESPRTSPIVFVVLTAIIAVIVILKHKGNIKRIFTGTEKKIWVKKSPGETSGELITLDTNPPEVKADGDS